MANPAEVAAHSQEMPIFVPSVLSFSDYYSFGMLMPGRNGVTDISNAYRYGFNGMEKDDEIKGSGNSYDFGARMYDSRIGRWLSLDPQSVKYPYESNYSAFGNNPILYIDIDGKDIIIYLADGSFIKYKPGMEVPKDNFAKKVVESLNKIYTTSEGSIVVTTLVDSNNKYNISQAKYIVSPDENQSFNLGKNGEYDKPFKELIKEKKYSKANKLLESIDELSIKIYSGNYEVAWDSHNYDNVKMNFTLGLGHELFHAYQFETGKSDGSFVAGSATNTENGVLLLEAQAVGFENYLRGSLYSNTKYAKPRTSYSGKRIFEFCKEQTLFDKIMLNRDDFDIKEFIEGGKAFNIWKNDFTNEAKKAIDKAKKNTTKNNNN